jgi:hypothetical protein
MIYSNKIRMEEFNQTQYLHENETWKRILEFIQTENVYLKNRLAQITRADHKNNFLEEIEQYQNELLAEDHTISMLRNDVSKQEKRLKKDYLLDRLLIGEISEIQKRLRKEIEIAEQKFNSLKFAFNNYFSEKLIAQQGSVD